MGGVTMATGPCSAGAGGAAMAGSLSWDSARVPTMAAFGVDVRRLLSTKGFAASGDRGAGDGDGEGDKAVRIARGGTGAGAACPPGRSV